MSTIAIREPKFKLNQEVFFMDFTTPKKMKILGITFQVGKFDKDSIEINFTQQNALVKYHFGGYTSDVEESKIFATKEELQQSLFKDIE